MKFRAAFLALAYCLIATAASAQSADVSAAAAAPPRVIMSWVPPYGIAAAMAQIKAGYGGAGPANSLSHLGLQFWKPTTAGGVVRVQNNGVEITDKQVSTFVNWGHNRDIKVLLTVYNGDPTWDWALAKSAFGTNKLKFVDALVNEMQRLNLDGIDVDLEGPGIDPTQDDKDKFIAFVALLAKRVHALGKIVNVDTFPYIWNAPNQTWWPLLFRYSDLVTSMGYDDLGRNGAGWQAYLYQRAKAGPANQSKLVIGLPSYVDSWQGDTAAAQVQWFVPSNIRSGVGIWDLQNQAAAWRSSAVWINLKKMRLQNR